MKGKVESAVSDRNIDLFAKRRDFLKGVGALSAGALLPSSVLAQSKTKTLKVAHIESTTSSTHKAWEKFAQLVKAKTNGSVAAEVFPAGQLGGLRDIFEGLRLGSIDMTSSGSDYTSNLAPIMVIPSMYYVWKSREHAYKVLDGSLGEEFNQGLQKAAGIRILAWGDLGWRSVFNKVRKIDKPEDMKGIKLRVPEAKLHLLPMRAFGASPVTIPYGEVYTAMQTNIVDGAEGTPTAVLQQKFNEVSKFYSLTEHLLLAIHAVISNGAFDRLSADEQKAVISAAKEAFTEQRATSNKDAAEALDKIKASGVAVNQVDKEAFRKIALGTWGELVEPLGASGKALLDKVIKS
jgi:tripartite ATP-independent transporter DctP family solute receptor